MPILYDESTRFFHLSSPNVSYVFHINAGGVLIHDYYGPKIPPEALTALDSRKGYSAGSGNITADGTTEISAAPQEISGNGAGDFRICALQIRTATGSDATDLRYVSHAILPGKPGIPGLPATYAEAEQATTLQITMKDPYSGVEAILSYTVFEELDALARHLRVVNATDKPIDLVRAYSANYELPYGDWQLCDLYGSWAKERMLERGPMPHGIVAVESNRGASGHAHSPFIGFAAPNADEETGWVFGFNFVYSGSFSMQAEKTTCGDIRVLTGINPQCFGWHLEAGEAFDTPESVSVFSANGLGGMSRTFHRLYRKHLCRGPWRDKKRPLLINNWEGTYFDFNEEKIFNIAKDAGELGIEMLVLDDGWFGARNNDRAGLGDWYVNEEKLKGGMGELSRRIHGLGMKFGLWFEPEMINPDSDLYRTHPDWCLHADGRPLSVHRHQYVLDLSRKDVRDYLFERMHSILSEAQIEYVKWDFNRNLSEAGSALLPPERQNEVMHRYMLGLYELLERLLTAHPDLLIEGCAGGGGRYDPGMLYYTPQIWTSDDTDAMERLYIQYGTTLCYPTSTLSSHVSACPNHQTGRMTPLRTRGDVALAGSFGYELDMTKVSDEEKQIVREQVAEYHKYYNVIHYGDLYRLIPPNDRQCAWCFVSEDRSEALLTFVSVRTTMQLRQHVRFRGLDPEKRYADEEGNVFSGAAWMNVGVSRYQRMKDGESFKIYLKEVQ